MILCTHLKHLNIVLTLLIYAYPLQRWWSDTRDTSIIIGLIFHVG